MKGYLYYPADEATRNQPFIHELLKEAKQLHIDLQLLLSKTVPTDASFVFFRARAPQLASEWEQAGIRLFNQAAVNAIANDKLKTYQAATALGLPTIPTQLVTNMSLSFIPSDSDPVVLKTIDGHGGQEVQLCYSLHEVEQVLTLWRDRTVIVQPYIESQAQDVRVFMLGDQILGAVKRTGQHSFKSNYTLGGAIEPYPLAAWQREQVQHIARTLDSDYIGIDFLLLPDDSWLLNEIEDPVGARSLYLTTDLPVAKRIMTYLKGSLSNDVGEK